MLVSIIMPVYNAGEKLRRSILSVLNQTYTNFELIIVDDGSTDHALQIITEFQDVRIKIIKQKNSGSSSARNTGLLACQGEYVCFIDADDSYHSMYLEELMKYEDDMVVCGIEKMGFKNNYQQYISAFSYQAKQFPNKMEYILNIGILNSPVNKRYKKSIIQKNNLKFRVDMKIGEDLNFNFNYLLVCQNIRYIDKNLYYYYIEATGTHNSYLQDVIKQRSININLIEAYFKKYHMKEILIDQMKVKLIYIYLMQEMGKRTKFRQMKKEIQIPYFQEIESVSGISYQVLLKIYKIQNIYLMVLMAFLLKFFKGKQRGASL